MQIPFFFSNLSFHFFFNFISKIYLFLSCYIYMRSLLVVRWYYCSRIVLIQIYLRASPRCKSKPERHQFSAPHADQFVPLLGYWYYTSFSILTNIYITYNTCVQKFIHAMLCWWLGFVTHLEMSRETHTNCRHKFIYHTDN